MCVFSCSSFTVDMVKGAKNVVFGGEGLFLTRLEGPGKGLAKQLVPLFYYSHLVFSLAARFPPTPPIFFFFTMIFLFFKACHFPSLLNRSERKLEVKR